MSALVPGCHKPNLQGLADEVDIFVENGNKYAIISMDLAREGLFLVLRAKEELQRGNHVGDVFKYYRPKSEELLSLAHETKLALADYDDKESKIIKKHLNASIYAFAQFEGWIEENYYSFYKGE